MHTRIRRIGSAVAAGLALIGVVAAAPSAHASVPADKPLHGLVQPLGRLLTAKSQSNEATLNWAGYAVPAGSGQITSVQATWIVPFLKTLPPGFSSTWVGIGGFDGFNDLIQAGTEQSASSGDYAWIEMLPASEVKLTGCSGDASCHVAPGDQMHVYVNNVGGDQWNLIVSNDGKWGYSKTVTYHSSLSSAEFVFEAPGRGVGVALPTLLPANAPHQQFLGGSSFVFNGTTQTLLTSPNRVRVTMSPIGIDPVDVAIPSAIRSDGAFNVCAYKLSCKTPGT